MTAPDRIGQKVRLIGTNSDLDGTEGVTIPAYGGRPGDRVWPKGKAVAMMVGAPFVTEHNLDELEVI